MLEILLAHGYTRAEAALYSYFKNYDTKSVVEDIEQQIRNYGKVNKEEE